VNASQRLALAAARCRSFSDERTSSLEQTDNNSPLKTVPKMPTLLTPVIGAPWARPSKCGKGRASLILQARYPTLRLVWRRNTLRAGWGYR